MVHKFACLCKLKTPKRKWGEAQDQLVTTLFLWKILLHSSLNILLLVSAYVCVIKCGLGV